ncbi:MAG: hypothetical protein HFJ48_00815 [Clostridia bacterium]|nr:hypothetical protein [Clostridia bacterium]
MLRNESTYKLPLNKNTYRAIKMQTGTTIDVEKFINDCINEYTDGETGNGLFNANNNLFWSESFLRRMQKYEDLKEKRSQAGKKAMQNRWGNKQNYNKVITKKQRKIKGISKNNKIITMLSKENNKVITNVIKNRNKVIAKNNKSNQIKSNQIKLKKIKLKDMKSIYPSDHKSKENKTLDEMMDEMEKMEFETIISNCEMHIFSPELSIEITEILKEMYMTPITRKRVLEVNSKKLLYALKNFAIANTKSRIQIPKAYFKKCILSALDQTELSTQYDTETIFEMEE